MTLPRTILVATDFSEQADQALEYAAHLASQLDATIHRVHVITIPSMGVPEIGVAYAARTIESMTKHAQSELDKRAAGYLNRVTLAPVRVEVGDARDVIDRVAEQIGADLIVMGTHGRDAIGHLFMGSVAERVGRTATCPVLTVHSPEREFVVPDALAAVAGA